MAFLNRRLEVLVCSIDLTPAGKVRGLDPKPTPTDL
jgi:hypothetical protein